MREDETAGPVDAIVVGAGVIGLACAWRLAGRGMSVRVLERDRPGAGASGVAAGMLAPVGEASWGEERLLALTLDAHDAWPAFASELAVASGRDPGLQRAGALHVALDRDEATELRHRFGLMERHGLSAEWLGPAACRALEPGLTPSLAGGVHSPHEAAIDPRRLVATLVVACERAGVEIESSSEVVDGLRDAGALAGVRTADGREHPAGVTVLAAGAWSGTVPWLRATELPPVRPVKGEIITLRAEPGAVPASRIVVTERMYAVPRPDGRLVIGATVEERGFDLRITAGGVHELLREGYRALPDVAELELVETVAGLRPGTPDNLPLVGPGSVRGLLLATGHYRNGILLAPTTAEAIAAHAAGEEPAGRSEQALPARFALVQVRG